MPPTIHIYFVSDVQSGTTSTSYMGLHKVDGNTGALLMSKTSGNGVATNYGNQNPILALEQFGSYLYLGTYIGNQISVTKFSKTDFSKVWGKVTAGLGTFNTNLSGPAMSVDQNGTVFVAANRATTSQTIIVRVPHRRVKHELYSCGSSHLCWHGYHGNHYKFESRSGVNSSLTTTATFILCTVQEQSQGILRLIQDALLEKFHGEMLTGDGSRLQILSAKILVQTLASATVMQLELIRICCMLMLYAMLLFLD